MGKTVEQVACSLKLLTILALNGCKLELWASSLFPSLRQLHLSSANTDDHVVKNLLGGCALLEVIIFDDCRGLKSLELAGLSNWDQDMEQLSWSQTAGDQRIECLFDWNKIENLVLRSIWKFISLLTKNRVPAPMYSNLSPLVVPMILSPSLTW